MINRLVQVKFSLALAFLASIFILILPHAAVGQGTIAPGQSVHGSLSTGQSLEYTFSGMSNTPILMSVQKGKHDLHVEFFDADGMKLKRYEYISTKKLPFTPQSNGTYKLVLSCTSGKDTFVMKMDYAAGPPEQRNKLIPLSSGESREGNLAADAYDEYSFTGSAGHALRFTIQRDTLDLHMTIFDDKGLEVQKDEYIDSNAKKSFTPPTTGTYKVRLRCSSGYGHYIIALSQ